MQRMACVYRFYNPATGKSYIGMTVDERVRFKNHHRDAEGGKRKTRFYAAVRKYGWDAFEYSVLAKMPEGASEAWLINAEKLAIAMFDSFLHGYNSTLGGETAPMDNPETVQKVARALLGRKHSDATRAKIRAAKLGLRHTDEARALMSAQRKGKKQSEAHAAKRGAAIRGEKNGMHGKSGALNPMFGKKRTDLAEANKRRIGPTNPRFGKKDTPETKAKRIAAQLARRARERAASAASSDTPR